MEIEQIQTELNELEALVIEHFGNDTDVLNDLVTRLNEEGREKEAQEVLNTGYIANVFRSAFCLACASIRQYDEQNQMKDIAGTLVNHVLTAIIQGSINEELTKAAAE